jgi:hypothetical protein
MIYETRPQRRESGDLLVKKWLKDDNLVPLLNEAHEGA